MSSWQRIDDVLTNYAKLKLEVGHVLTFNQNGELHSYKIMRIYPKTGHYWVKEIWPIDPEQFAPHANHEVDVSEATRKHYGGPICFTCNVIIGTEIQPSSIKFSGGEDEPAQQRNTPDTDDN